MRRFFLAALLSLLPTLALAQTCPTFTTGMVLTAGQWNACFASKQNVLGYTPLNKAGDTMTGRLVISAPTGNVGFLNLTPGNTPGSPNNGDLWVTSSGLFVRIAGTTVGPLIGGPPISGVVQGDIFYGSAANTISNLAKSTSATRYLSNTGTNNNPAWAQVALATGVSGILPPGNGGTNSAFFSVAGLTATRTITVPDASDTMVTLSANQILVSKTLTSPIINSGALSGGTINNMDIGNVTPGTAVFSTVSSAAATLTGGTINGMIIGGSTPAAGTFTTLNSTGGALNGTIGATTPAAATVTTLTVNTSATIPANGLTVGTNQIATASGNVGIRRTASSSIGLAVTTQSGCAANANCDILHLGNGSDIGLVIGTRGPSSSPLTYAYAWTDSAKDVVLGANAAEALRIVASTGFVGFGAFGSASVNAQMDSLGSMGCAVTSTSSSINPLTGAHCTILCDASGGTVTLTLPAASSSTSRRIYRMKKTDSSANQCILSGTIDGDTSISINTQYDSATVQANSAQWWRL